MKIVDESILFFSRVSQNSLWKLSTFRGYKSIYIGMCLECEESVFSKQSGLATWPRDLTES